MTDRFPHLGQATLPEVLLARRREAPQGVASVIVHADGEDEVYTIAELLGLAERFAVHFRPHVVQGRQLLICVCLYHGVRLHAAFLGAMLVGQIPSMIAPPSPRMERDKYIDSFVRMLRHLRPDVLVADATVLDALRELDADASFDGVLLDAADVPLAGIDAEVPSAAHVTDDAIALLQHSSGTTGLQKGVALSHRAVLSQIRAYTRAIDLRAEDVIVSWLPLYHDMGLIACFVLPLLSGVPLIELSAFEWVSRPGLLIEKASRYGATLCWLPNFAYAFLSKSIRGNVEELGRLDRLRAFVNCSEPVMAASHDEFVERFKTIGVDATKLSACYAMAENVFAVTQTVPASVAARDRISRDVFEREHRAEPLGDDLPDEALVLVSNGGSVDGVEIRIVDDTDAPLAERHVGEICIRGESLFSGYFRRDDLTRSAMLGDWYRTGDLGYLADGELYVTGRKKDLIIIQGRNFYPADIEAVVAEADAVIAGRVAAFGEVDTANGTESLIILAETAEDDPREQGTIKREIRGRVAQSFDCTLGGIHLVPPRWLIKSTAGKVARADNRAKYERLLKR